MRYHWHSAFHRARFRPTLSWLNSYIDFVNFEDHMKSTRNAAFQLVFMCFSWCFHIHFHTQVKSVTHPLCLTGPFLDGLEIHMVFSWFSYVFQEKNSYPILFLQTSVICKYFDRRRLLLLTEPANKACYIMDRSRAWSNVTGPRITPRFKSATTGRACASVWPLWLRLRPHGAAVQIMTRNNDPCNLTPWDRWG